MAHFFFCSLYIEAATFHGTDKEDKLVIVKQNFKAKTLVLLVSYKEPYIFESCDNLNQ